MADDLRAEALNEAALLDAKGEGLIGTSALLRRLAAALPQPGPVEWPDAVLDDAALALVRESWGIAEPKELTDAHLVLADARGDARAALTSPAVQQHIAAREAAARAEGIEAAARVAREHTLPSPLHNYGPAGRSREDRQYAFAAQDIECAIRALLPGGGA